MNSFCKIPPQLMAVLAEATFSTNAALIETAKQNGIAPEDYLRCLFEKAPYAETENDWEKLLPWNIEITPYKIRGEWI